jgi:5-methyltetrahydrofolate--homocysteine methyltransferase
MRCAGSQQLRALSWQNTGHVQAVALYEGGVDLFLVETIFDTLNAKAAIYALEDFFSDYNVRLPVFVSGTIVDNSGRTLSGQTNEAFWNSVRHAKPFAIGLNCALGADDMLPYIANLSECCDCYVFAYPNAGLPNAMGGYDQTGSEMAAEVQPFCERGLVNAIGGCCGSTAAHIAALKAMASNFPTRERHGIEPLMRISGLEPLNYRPKLSNYRETFLKVGERCNVAGSILYKKAIVDGNYDKAAAIALKQVCAPFLGPFFRSSGLLLVKVKVLMKPMGLMGSHASPAAPLLMCTTPHHIRTDVTRGWHSSGFLPAACWVSSPEADLTNQ